MSNPRKFRLSWDFYPWTFMLGACVDPHVLASGDFGMERRCDITLMLGCFEVELEWVRGVCTPWERGDSLLDLVFRHHEAHETNE